NVDGRRAGEREIRRAREHRDRARGPHDCAGRKDAQGLSPDREAGPSPCRWRTVALPAELVQSADRRQMSAWLLVLALQVAPPHVLVGREAPAAAPAVITLQDALDRAKQNDVTFQTAIADAAAASGDRVQAKASMLPTISASTQYLGNSATPNNVLPNGRFVSLDGTKMYRAWGIAREDLSANVLLGTTLHRAQAAEVAAQQKLEVARRGLALTVTRNYYALVTAQRKYATAQQAAQQAQRFLTTTRQQQQLGQVARADTIKAELAFQQQQQA